jgi:cob(I)alamin adenosyltransferase
MKIYTKKGDDGTTGLIGGTRVSKSELRIETYGTVDELNSYIGWVRDLASRKEISDMLIIIQDKLFTIGSHLAADPEKSRMKLPDILEEDVTTLENWIDQMDTKLPEMKSFVLPGGHSAVSCTHVSRCVCRRAERLVVALSKSENVEIVILHYLNRLSDFLFTLSRLLAKEFNAPETPWIPKQS